MLLSFLLLMAVGVGIFLCVFWKALKEVHPAPAVIIPAPKDPIPVKDCQLQVDKLKQILQGHIDLLKKDNKALKAELARAIDENVVLQAKVFAAADARRVDIQQETEEKSCC